MERSIVHLKIPDFYAAVEELRKPELKRKPLVLAEPGDRSVVQSLNLLARREGISEGMPLSQAKRLSRRLCVLPSDLYHYRERHGEIVRDFGRFSPLIEGTYPGHYFIDVTGTRRLWGPGPDIACRMEKELAGRSGFHARIGLAVNKLVSQVAARCIDPGDLSCVFPGNESSFLAPLPVSYLPGVGESTASRLFDFNIRQIGQIASLPSRSLADVFGKTADRLVRMSRGVDITPVLPFQRVPKFSIIRTLDRDEIDRDKLESVLFRQVEEAGWSFRSHNRTPARFRVEVRYADGFSAEDKGKLPLWAAEADRLLFRLVLPVFRRVFSRRVAVRRMVLEFLEFSMPMRQLQLFSWETKADGGADIGLQKALDGIRTRFGKEAVSWGRARENKGNVIPANSHEPVFATNDANPGRPGFGSPLSYT